MQPESILIVAVCVAGIALLARNAAVNMPIDPATGRRQKYWQRRRVLTVCIPLALVALYWAAALIAGALDMR